MASGGKWSEDETLMAFALYFILPPREYSETNRQVKGLAKALGRTPAAVKLKLWNISAFDEMRKVDDKVGMRNGSRLDREVWKTYAREGDALLGHAIELLSDAFARAPILDDTTHLVATDLPVGKDRLVIATTRVNQSYFRNTLLDNYDHRCCVTGLALDPLLVASHIKPWSEADPITERLAPDNGLLLNALHDRAFDKGLMTIDESLRIFISPEVGRDDASNEWLWRYDGCQISIPRRARPRREYIEYHNDVIFRH
jgi:putative restriction endonuclease